MTPFDAWFEDVYGDDSDQYSTTDRDALEDVWTACEKRILDKLNALAEQQLGYANDPKHKDNRVAHHHAANILGILRGDVLGYKSP